MKMGSLITLLLLASAPSFGAEGDRESPTPEIQTLRAEMDSIEQSIVRVAALRDAAAKELDSIAQRIENKKKENPSTGLLPDFEMQNLLSRSQELSTQWTKIHRELETLELARAQKLQLLSRTYDQRIETLRKSIPQAEPSKQGEMLSLLTTLRRERDLIREKIAKPVILLAPVSTSDEQLLSSDDPEELSERADAVRDEQDRLRRQLTRVNQRVDQIEAETRIDRELRDFIGDQNLFAEDSKTLRLSQPVQAGLGKNTIDTETGNQNSFVAPEFDTPDARKGNLDPVPGDSMSLFQDPSCESPAQEYENTGSEREALAKERARIVDRIKKLQILYDRLQEKTESLSQ
jgi:hypothetical protein